MNEASKRTDAAIAESDKPIVREYHSNNCTPCITGEDMLLHATVHPVFPAKVVNINIDELPQYADRFSIKSVPSVVLVEQVKPATRFSGLVDAGSAISAIEDIQAN